MQIEGRLKSWNDERGFGFIETHQGGQEIFAHIKAFPAGTGRPVVGQLVSFEVELNADGKKRAKKIRPIAPARSMKKVPDSPAQWGTASYFTLPAFFVLYAGVSVVWHVPRMIAGWYLLASLLCYAAYAMDKAAARQGAWRTPEGTLLLLGLAGGWPGAIVAQQRLRHKSSKASFRSAFWASVAANVAGFVLLSSPLAARGLF